MNFQFRSSNRKQFYQITKKCFVNLKDTWYAGTKISSNTEHLNQAKRKPPTCEKEKYGIIFSIFYYELNPKWRSGHAIFLICFVAIYLFFLFGPYSPRLSNMQIVNWWKSNSLGFSFSPAGLPIGRYVFNLDKHKILRKIFKFCKGVNVYP